MTDAPDAPRPPEAVGLPVGCIAVIGMLAGAVALPLVIFLVAIALYNLDPSCSGGGMNGGCAMGVAAATMAATIPGAIIGLIVGLWRGFRRRRKSET